MDPGIPAAGLTEVMGLTIKLSGVAERLTKGKVKIEAHATKGARILGDPEDLRVLMAFWALFEKGKPDKKAAVFNEALERFGWESRMIKVGEDRWELFGADENEVADLLTEISNL